MASSTLPDDQLRNLLSRLQTLLPQLNHTLHTSTVSTAEILKETCDYIKKLQREVDDLSERLWKQLDSMGVDFEMVKHLLN
ncbi:Transcription factor PRE5 [Cucurbita argyrosperma subsp. argyrosperma]|nr:Transcription factor PRE5 [Cucurbita argyrosperma subsp. argyrosperma]